MPAIRTATTPLAAILAAVTQDIPLTVTELHVMVRHTNKTLATVKNKSALFIQTSTSATLLRPTAVSRFATIILDPTAAAAILVSASTVTEVLVQASNSSH